MVDTQSSRAVITKLSQKERIDSSVRNENNNDTKKENDNKKSNNDNNSKRNKDTQKSTGINAVDILPVSH